MRNPAVALGGAGLALALAALALIVGSALAIALLLSLFPGDEQDQPASGPGVHCRPGDEAETASDESNTSPEAQVPDEYDEAVSDAAAEAQLPEAVIAAQIYYESGWDESATSVAGAEGIAQFMPATWAEYGQGDISDPDAAIAAQGRYMADLRAQMQDLATSEDELVELTLASYNAGPQPVIEANGVPNYPETQNYVTNITAASDGASGSFCSVPQGDIVAASGHLAWEDYRTTDQAVGPAEYAANPRHGEDESRDEYITTAEGIHDDINYAFFTDCGAFVSTAIRSSGIDPNFALRGTGAIEQYVTSSDDWDTFTPTNEGELQPGDVMIATYAGGSQAEAGHTYIYTGQRADTDEQFDRAQGASLGTRPPAAHAVPLTAGRGGVPYTAARYIGDNPAAADSDDQEDPA